MGRLNGLIIGSTAARWWLSDWREPKDFDIFTPQVQEASQVTMPRRVEPFWHPRLEPFVPGGNTIRMATLDELYTIKVSHSQWDLRNGSWEKHIEDAAALKRAGAKLDWEFYLALVAIWKEIHGEKRVSLTQDKDAFFDDAVPRIYDHDSVHYSVAYGDRPLYEDVFDGGAQIAMDMSKIKALPFEEQVRLYREEIYATALERWVIPANYRCSPRWAYARALKKTIVSLTKGWSSRFLIENYDVFRKPDMDYVRHHKSKAHLLIPLEGKN
jgi:hypothetical protein